MGRDQRRLLRPDHAHIGLGQNVVDRSGRNRSRRERRRRKRRGTGSAAREARSSGPSTAPWWRRCRPGSFGRASRGRRAASGALRVRSARRLGRRRGSSRRHATLGPRRFVRRRDVAGRSARSGDERAARSASAASESAFDGLGHLVADHRRRIEGGVDLRLLVESPRIPCLTLSRSASRIASMN